MGSVESATQTARLREGGVVDAGEADAERNREGRLVRAQGHLVQHDGLRTAQEPGRVSRFAPPDGGRAGGRAGGCWPIARALRTLRSPWFSAEPPRSRNLRCARRPHTDGRRSVRLVCESRACICVLVCWVGWVGGGG